MKNISMFVGLLIILNSLHAKSVFDQLTVAVRAPQKFKLNFSSDPKIDKLNGLPPVKRVKDKPCPFKMESENDAFDDALISLFMAGNFKKLNSELKRVNGMRTLYGSSLICRSIDALRSRYKGFSLAKSWNDGSFHSEFSECILGHYLTAKAWKARGEDYANTIMQSVLGDFICFPGTYRSLKPQTFLWRKC